MTTGKIIGRGATAEIFELDGGRVLKLFRSHMLKAHSEQEFNNTRIAASCGIRVPEALDYIELDGRFGIVFERITGASLMKLLSNPISSGKYAKVLAALQHEMH